MRRLSGVPMGLARIGLHERRRRWPLIQRKPAERLLCSCRKPPKKRMEITMAWKREAAQYLPVRVRCSERVTH